MEKVILSSDSPQAIEKIIALAEKHGISVKKLTREEIEDIGLSIAIKKGRTGEHTDTGSFLKMLENVEYE